MKTNFLIVIATIMFLLPNVAFSQSEAKAKKVETIRIQTNLHCHDCKEKIELELANVRGVKTANADVSTKIVTVEFSPKKTNKETIISSIQKIGFQAKETNSCYNTKKTNCQTPCDEKHHHHDHQHDHNHQH
ncbi:MAG: cation transporter [Bacteroidales bacterium]|mgnify:CR=1 FL=1|jgi:copper chaperone CopZ|nr:cation transporter [Bacteroidales bacterium]